MNISRCTILRCVMTLVIAATIWRLLDCIIDNPLDHLFSDPKRHWNNALLFWTPNLMGGADPLMYQVYLYLVQQLTGCNRLAIGIITGMLSAIMPWFYYKTVREFEMSRFMSLVVWLLIAVIPSFWGLYNFFMMETLLLPLTGLSLWMTGRYLRKQSFYPFMVMCASWGLCCLTKSSLVPVAAISILYCLWCENIKWRWLPAAMVLGIVLLLPNAIRTHKILGYSCPLGMPWIVKVIQRMETKHIEIYWNNEYWKFSSPSAYIMPFEPLNYWRIERGYNDLATTVRIQSVNGEKDWIKAYKQLPFDFNVWWRGQKENLALLLFAQSWPESNYETFKGRINYLNRWLWAPLIFLVLIGNIKYVRYANLNLIPILTTILFLFFLLQPFALIEGRYRKPLESLLIMNLMWLVIQFVDKYRRKKHVP